MRYPVQKFLLSTALLCALGAMAYAQAPTPAAPQRTVQNFVPVTDAMMRAPKPEDWLMYRGNYAGWAYSPLDKINKTNVKNLQLVWSRAMAPGDNEITPIVYNGVMYVANPNDVIQAIDATSGDLLWEYKHPLPAREALHNHQGEHKRSLALYGNFIIFVSFDNIVVGLDARTGQRMWQQARGGDGYVTNSSGVLVANGMVI